MAYDFSGKTALVTGAGKGEAYAAAIARFSVHAAISMIYARMVP